MELEPQNPGGRQFIQAYGGQGFRISGVRHAGSVIVLPQATFAWEVAGIETATAESLAAVTGFQPKVEILLIGTGLRMLPLLASLRAHFRQAGIMIDGMDTGAACRTYNVLTNEDRRVAAALILPV